MCLPSEVGAPIDPNDPNSPTVSEVLAHKVGHDCWNDIVIVRDSNDKWLANRDDGSEMVVADSAQELAERLWNAGDCSSGIAYVMFKLGWLSLNQPHLKMADKIAWRKRHWVPRQAQ